jgi:electron transfer flavoprotein alpha subunit
MGRIFVIAEHDNHRLNGATARCVQCAASVPGAEIHVLVFGMNAAAVADEAARLSGVAGVTLVDSPAYEHPLAAVVAPAAAELAAGATHVFGPSTTFGKDLMPRIAALLDVGQVSDIMAVESERRFRRPVYAGNAIVTVDVTDDGPVVGTVRIASYGPAAPSANAAPVTNASPAGAAPSHTRFVSLSAPGGDRPDLQGAARVVSGGRALGSAENFRMIEALADALGAAIGASRAAVDAGYAPNELQVGQTGKIIAPELYIAVGISGAIQHMTGIKDARTIVAINKDGDAPIFEAADIGLVGDLFTILPDLTARLANKA